MSEKLSARQLRRKRHEQLLRAYEKNRRRNLLAQPGVHDFILVLDHLKAGYNVPKIFRSAEAFGAREVQLIDIGPFDPSPAKGAFRQVPARFFGDFDESHSDLMQRGYQLYALSPDNSRPLHEEQFPRSSAFIFGHEELGLSFSASEYPHIQHLHIPQFGQVQSLNVSIAASIVMYEYTRQMHP
ncbi:TrmH family RNA methyltransferase [Thiolapillus sp.]